MCNVDDCDSAAVIWNQSFVKKSRKARLCHECNSEISVGQSYHRIDCLADGHWSNLVCCVDCKSGWDWLDKHCGGFTSEGAYEELVEHLRSGYKEDNLAGIVNGMRSRMGREPIEVES